MKTLLILLVLSASAFSQNVTSISTNPGTASRTLTPEQKKGLAAVVVQHNTQAQIVHDAAEALKPVGERVAYVPVAADAFLLDSVLALLNAWESDRRAKVAAEPTVKEISDKLPTLKATKRAAILAAILAEQEP